jgi:hypothetical protein
MKIAVCFSGEPRFVEECYPLIKRNIIDANEEVDFFVHTWYSDETADKKLYTNSISSFGESTIKKDVVDRIKDLYNPISIIVDEPIKFKSEVDWGNSIEKYFSGGSNINKEFRDIKISNMYSFLYSNMKSIFLKKEFELKEGFTYDVVIRFRFDNIVRHPIIFSNYNMDFLHYQEMGQPDRMVSDWINFSNSKNMDTYSSIFNNFENLTKICLSNYGAYSPESLIRAICDVFNIQTQSHSFGIELPRHGKI